MRGLRVTAALLCLVTLLAFPWLPSLVAAEVIRPWRLLCPWSSHNNPARMYKIELSEGGPRARQVRAGRRRSHRLQHHVHSPTTTQQRGALPCSCRPPQYVVAITSALFCALLLLGPLADSTLPELSLHLEPAVYQYDVGRDWWVLLEERPEPYEPPRAAVGWLLVCRSGAQTSD